MKKTLSALLLAFLMIFGLFAPIKTKPQKLLFSEEDFRTLAGLPEQTLFTT